MKKIVVSILIVIGIITGGFVFYTSDYYHASDYAMQIMEDECVETYDDYYVFMPEEVKAGFIFYPGGLVETQSYAPFMKECAKQGILCVLVKMPFHLAVLNVDGADGIIDQYDVDHWYIGGHSLGGSMAASYVSKHIDEYEGLILLASYSTEDLSQSGLEVLSVYGSEDGVLNKEKYRENITNLPLGFVEHIIDGGNHAYFGNYGEQDKDGKAHILPDEQINMTIDYMKEFVNGVE